MKIQIDVTYLELALIKLALIESKKDFTPESMGAATIKEVLPRIDEKMNEYVMRQKQVL